MVGVLQWFTAPVATVVLWLQQSQSLPNNLQLECKWRALQRTVLRTLITQGPLIAIRCKIHKNRHQMHKMKVHLDQFSAFVSVQVPCSVNGTLQLPLSYCVLSLNMHKNQCTIDSGLYLVLPCTDQLPSSADTWMIRCPCTVYFRSELLVPQQNLLHPTRPSLGPLHRGHAPPFVPGLLPTIRCRRLLDLLDSPL